MSILRKDPLSHGWVIFAEERYQRPPELAPPEPYPPREHCPFCEGHEKMTPPEIRAMRPPNSKPNFPGWTVRAIPNQFAVLRIEGMLERRGEGLYDMMNGIGANEVIIESPEHEAMFCEFPVEKIRDILWMYRERSQDLLKDTRFRYIQIFRNYGDTAGANITHPHSQIIALPIMPRWVRDEITHAYDHWLLKERCLFCDIIQQDSGGPRLVYENDEFVALAPFASKFPFETWIYPRQHIAGFHETSDPCLTSLADALKLTLTAFNRTMANPPYNVIFHSAPHNPEKRLHNPRAQLKDYYHWHIEIIPRAAKVAGFEYGTGFYINPVLPESAAEYLRAVVSETQQTAEA